MTDRSPSASRMCTAFTATENFGRTITNGSPSTLNRTLSFAVIFRLPAVVKSRASVTGVSSSGSVAAVTLPSFHRGGDQAVAITSVNAGRSHGRPVVPGWLTRGVNTGAPSYTQPVRTFLERGTI